MNKNCVERHRVRDKLATDSEVQKGSKQPDVNAARVRGKKLNLIRGGLSLSGGHKSAEAIVSDGVTTIQGGYGNQAQVERLSRRTEGRATAVRTAETWKDQDRYGAKS
jgi:hypothetical protein